MLRLVKNNIPEKELHTIAKTIQWHYKSRLACNYEAAFLTISRITSNENNKYKLREAMSEVFNPSNKFHDSKEANKLLVSILRARGEEGVHPHLSFLINFRLPSLEMIKLELRALMKDFNGIDFYDDTLVVEMGPFCIEEEDFGSFQINTNMRSYCSYRPYCYPTAIAVTPNYPKGDDDDGGYTHPHVCDTEICLGEGKRILSSAMAEGRLQDCFEIVRSVLKTYNSEDPYLRIEAWTGQVCRNCDESYSNNDEMICLKCERSFCSSCVKECCSQSGYVCYDCRAGQFSCVYCGEYMCPECVEICKSCSLKLCSYHNKPDRHRCV